MKIIGYVATALILASVLNGCGFEADSHDPLSESMEERLSEWRRARAAYPAEPEQKDPYEGVTPIELGKVMWADDMDRFNRERAHLIDRPNPL